MTDNKQPQGSDFGAVDEFADESLQALVKAAFDALEPSEDAIARMRESLVAREAHTENASSDLFKMPVPAAREPFVPEKPKPAEEGTATAADNAEPAAETDAVKPKAKRVISPWKIIVPAAAALAAVGIIVAVGPLAGILNPPVQEAAKDAQATSAQPASEASSESEEAMLDSAASSSSGASSADAAKSADAAAASSSSAASTSSDGSSAPTEEANAAASGSSSGAAQEEEAANAKEDAAPESASATNEAAAAEESAESDAPENAQDAEEENHAEAYPDIRVFIDQEYRLTIDSRTPVAVELRGDYIADATAYNADETASMSCVIYARTDSDDTYLISYLGEEKYYPAHVLD